MPAIDIPNSKTAFQHIISPSYFHMRWRAGSISIYCYCTAVQTDANGMWTKKQFGDFMKKLHTISPLCTPQMRTVQSPTPSHTTQHHLMTPLQAPSHTHHSLSTIFHQILHAYRYPLHPNSTPSSCTKMFATKPFPLLKLPLLPVALILCVIVAFLHSHLHRPPPICTDSSLATDRSTACIPLHNLTERTFIHRVNATDVVYMYCSIPKNGCSYHIDLLHRVNHDFFKGISKHRPYNKHKIVLNDSQEAANLLSNPNVPKYMVIRNPLTRILSGYLCKVEKYLPEADRTAEAFQRWARDQLTNLSWLDMNSHWRAQTTFCGYDLRDVQTKFSVFRVEKPAQYVDFIYDHVPHRVLDKGWGQNKTDFRSFVLGPRVRTSNTELKFYRYIATVEFFDFLANAFDTDIRVLDYRREVDEMRRALMAFNAMNITTPV